MSRATGVKKKLSSGDKTALTELLRSRFEKNMPRHKRMEWAKIEAKFDDAKLWSLNEMERTGGEPDVLAYDSTTGEYIFYDCSPESPAGRRSLCFDHEALEARKENKPKDSALNMASMMGIKLLSESEYRELQKHGKFDAKTSSWIETPAGIRKLGGALFADLRYNTIFIYHNGAESYYAARGFRGTLKV